MPAHRPWLDSILTERRRGRRTPALIKGGKLPDNAESERFQQEVQGTPGYGWYKPRIHSNWLSGMRRKLRESGGEWPKSEKTRLHRRSARQHVAQENKLLATPDNHFADEQPIVSIARPHSPQHGDNLDLKQCTPALVWVEEGQRYMAASRPFVLGRFYEGSSLLGDPLENFTAPLSWPPIDFWDSHTVHASSGLLAPEPEAAYVELPVTVEHSGFTRIGLATLLVAPWPVEDPIPLESHNAASHYLDP
ncbi:hypothetical protein BN946_scf184936.g14 [Trametes cinnabarina]|uniref:Uncharacterized protein n=1 Tax=Pycnoporus cinnabarinus TaxID=5643 RepID=A0A060SZ90_PYCCI|nr:hypothetical protein BN946_scf184936.g14 [Trametes cinnabarina]